MTTVMKKESAKEKKVHRMLKRDKIIDIGYIYNYHYFICQYIARPSVWKWPHILSYHQGGSLTPAIENKKKWHPLCVSLLHPPEHSQNPLKICQTWAQAQRAKIQFGTSSYPHLAGRATPMFYLSWAKRAPHWFSYMYTGWQWGYEIFLVNASLSTIQSICQ